jgi:hypothetical protein
MILLILSDADDAQGIGATCPGHINGDAAKCATVGKSRACRPLTVDLGDLRLCDRCIKRGTLDSD